jgi:hypothetical protein
MEHKEIDSPMPESGEHRWLNYANPNLARKSTKPLAFGALSLAAALFQIVWTFVIAFWSWAYGSADQHFAKFEMVLGMIVLTWPMIVGFVFGCLSIKLSKPNRRNLLGIFGLSLIILEGAYLAMACILG